MAEYIERESLILDIEANKLMAREPAAKRILQMIENQHTADVRPERYGVWLYCGDSYECSECGGGSVVNTNPYCWKCGAKMDGKDIDK